MKRGDVMRINVDELVDFYVDGQKYFTAEMGEIKGNACVKLAKRLN
jgi:flagellar motor switch protein FliM